jgi:uncharacterized membrane protein YsdA (DUF1294 family)
MNSIGIFPLYLIAINVITFVVYGIDKIKAKEHWWRISEATLLLLAAFGGSLGAWAGMYVFHHKTKHKKFKWGVPAILLLQLALLWWLR